MPPFKIAIVGGGPVGCTLARLLLQSNINVTVFESEVSPDVRDQGGTLDLHAKTGLAALKAAGLYDEFLKYARFDGEAMLITDKKLTPWLKVGGATALSSRGRPEIDRSQLREILYASLPEGVIRWGMKLRKVDAALGLWFDSGVERGFDLVVGADGAWSKVRPLVSKEEPQYTGIGGIAVHVSNAAENFPTLYKLVNRGSVFAFSDGKSIMGQQLGNGKLRSTAWSVRMRDWKERYGPNMQNGRSVKGVIMNEFRDWSSDLVHLILAGDEDEQLWATELYMLPVGHRWDNRPGVTLAGDAAHLTVPFAGEGVNLGMQDAMKLREAIVRAQQVGSLEALFQEIRTYEEDMFVRAKAVAELSVGHMNDMFFTVGSPRTTIERYVIRGMASEFSPAVMPLATVLAYIYFWVFKLIY